MKLLCALVLLTLGSLIQLRADSFSGSDNFNSTSVNSANWITNPTVGGSSINDGLGSLQQTDGVIQYTANNGSGSDTQVWLWNVGVASLSTSWTMQMDVSNQVISSAVTNSGTSIGIGVADTDNLLGNNLTLKLANTHDVQEFSSKSTISGTENGEFSSSTTSTEGTLQLSYNATTQLITVGYDQNVGDQFTILYTFDPSTSCSMGTTDSLSFFIVGSSDSVPVEASNEVYGDNFSVQVAPEPSETCLLITGMVLMAGFLLIRKGDLKI